MSDRITSESRQFGVKRILGIPVLAVRHSVPGDAPGGWEWSWWWPASFAETISAIVFLQGMNRK